MEIKYYLKKVRDLKVPTRANKTDAGYDIVATSGPRIVGTSTDGYINDSKSWYEITYVEYETNLYFVPDNGFTKSSQYWGANDIHNVHTDIRARSSISSKTNFVLANSVALIDRGYHGQVLLRFRYIWQPTDLRVFNGTMYGDPNLNKMYKKGDVIAQLLPMITHDIKFELVDELPGEDRGGGFGSTDAKKETKIEKPKLVERPYEFRIGKKTSIERYYGVELVGAPRIDQISTEEMFRKYDGDIYQYSEGFKQLEDGLLEKRGLCIIDSSGQLLYRLQLFG